MRWWRRGGVWVGGFRALAWLGLLLGVALTVAGCATSPTNEVFASAARINTEGADQEGDGTPPAPVRQARDEPHEPTRGSSASGSHAPISAFLSDLLGSPPHASSAIDEEALIARAIAEHEMRKP